MFENLKARLSALKEKVVGTEEKKVDWNQRIRNFFEVCRWFNIQLTTAFGITTTIHWSVLLVLLWLAVSSPMSAGLMLIALLSVVPHEYGHALAARIYKINTQRIVIYPIGGIAFLENGLVKMEKWRELVIAAAGPAVSFVLAIIGLGMFILQGPSVQMTQSGELIRAFHPTGLWFYFFAINTALVLFNILPIFPMDGGRMLRAVLSFFMDYVRATRVCVYISMVLGMMLAVLGLLYGNVTLAITMMLICFMGRGELMAAEMRQAAENGEKFKAEHAAAKEKEKEEAAIDIEVDESPAPPPKPKPDPATRRELPRDLSRVRL